MWFWELGYRIGPNLWVIPMCTAAVSVGVYAITRRLDRLVVEPDGVRLVPEFLVARSPADAALVLSALLAALAARLWSHLRSAASGVDRHGTMPRAS